RFDDVTSATNLGQALLVGNGSTFGPTGTGVITANAITAGTYGINISGNAATATSLAGNLAGDLPYQSAPGTTAFLNIGANNTILKSNGTVPSWGTISASNMTAGDYTSVMTSGSYTINIAGNAGTVTNGVYTTGSYADPSWLTSLSGSKITGAMTGTTIGFDDVTSATNLGQSLLVGNGSTLGPTGTGVITANAITAGTYGISITGNAATATSLAGNLAGDLPYQSAAGTTSFLNIGANNTILKSNGTVPSWGTISASNMSAGDYSSVMTSGSYTINIAGNAGTVTNGVYTTGSYADPSWLTSLSGSKITGAMTGSTIGFDDVTSATNLGQALLIGNGSTLGPTGTGVITANAITAGTYGINISGNAATATSLAGNLAGDLPYQSAPGTTSFLNIGANNTILKSNGTVPSWGTISASNMTAGDYSSVLTSGSYTINIAGNAGTAVKVNNSLSNGAGISSLSFDGSASQSVAIDYTAAGTWTGLQTFNSPGVDINAGNIDGTTIGGTTPAAGSFTSVTVSSSVASPGNVLSLNNSGTGIAVSVTDNGGGVKLGYGTGTVVTDAVTIDGDRNSVYYVTSDNNSTNDVITVSNGANGQILYVVFYRATGAESVSVSGATGNLVPGGNGYVGITLVRINGTWKSVGSNTY
ncbi:MAG: hypothetical protein M1419_02495, partial [Bacteroidetes bacterium]|nr:hypothetical protein [Bacteroidota bacterium]